MKTAKKILIDLKTGKKYLVKDINSEFHTSNGVIAAEDMKSEGEVKSSKGENFLLVSAGFSDLWGFLKRGPQVVLPKDIGLIIAKTGANKDFKVVDAGGGSGSLCCSLANVCGEVVTYEIQKELVEVLEKNKKLMGLKNLKIKQGNIYEGISEKSLELITLDLARPWEVVSHTEKSLKLGGYLVVYLPNIIQVKKFVDGLGSSRIRLLEVVELLERRWKVEGQVVRPEYEMLGHTGFLVFGRRY